MPKIVIIDRSKNYRKEEIVICPECGGKGYYDEYHQSICWRCRGKMLTNKSSNILAIIFCTLFKKREEYQELFDNNKLNIRHFERFFYKLQKKENFVLYEFVPDFIQKRLKIGKKFWNDLVELHNAEIIIYERENLYIAVTERGEKFSKKLEIYDDSIKKVIYKLNEVS